MARFPNPYLGRTAGPGGDRAVEEHEEHDGESRVGDPRGLYDLVPWHGALLPQLTQLQVVVGLEPRVVGTQPG
jgi:hypothetical protein